jgi:hypothetical protein
MINPEAIWCLLRFEKKDEKDTLKALSRAMLSIWCQHWRIVMDKQTWNEQRAWSMYLNFPKPTTGEPAERP